MDQVVKEFFQSLWNYIVVFVEYLFFPWKEEPQLLCTNGFQKKGEADDIQPFSAIPHAKGLPFIGTVVDLIRFGGGTNFHKYILWRHEQLGRIYRETMGARDLVFLEDPALFIEFKKQEGLIPLPVTTPSNQVYLDTYKDSIRGLLLSRTEETWYKPRKMLNKVLLKRTSEFTDVYMGYQRFLVDVTIPQWRAASATNGTILPNVSLQVSNYVQEALLSVTLGERYTEHLKATGLNVADGAKYQNDVFTNSNKMMSLDPRIAKTLRLPVWRQYVQSMQDGHKFATTILETGIDCINDDSLSHSLHEDGILYKMLMEEHTTSAEAIRLLIGFLCESVTSLSSGVIWVIYAVARNAHIQEKILDEINRICGKNPVTVYDVQHFNYLLNVVNETLRMYPTAILVPRLLTNDVIVGGYRIPAGKIVCLSTVSAHFNPKYFPNPERLWPERWTKTEGSLERLGVTDMNAYIPFGIGGRKCIGRHIALMTIEFLIATLVQTFKMECDEVSPVINSVMVPDKELQLKLTSRMN